MMASMGPGFPHPGMQQHPGGHPGHPMAPGMAHNPSQPGSQPGGMPPQMAHMGVSGPGGQVNPAAFMGGMPPGAGGPNAHAMQHLNPQMFQQQQQQQHQHQMAMVQNNPQLMAQMQQQQQQRLVAQQQQQARQMMAQQMYGNMGNGVPMGIPPGMNAAQFAAIQRNAQGMRPVSLQTALAQQGLQHHPQNASQAQMLAAQQLAMQQQQQAAQNHPMHQGGQPGQMNAQQLQLQQQQAHQQAQFAALQAQQAQQAQGQNQAQQPQQQAQQQSQHQQHAHPVPHHQQQQAQPQQPQQQAQQQQPQQQPPQQPPQQQQQPPHQPGQQPQPQNPQNQPSQPATQPPQHTPTPAPAPAPQQGPNQPPGQGQNQGQPNQPQQPQSQSQAQNAQQTQAQASATPQMVQAAQQQMMASNLQQMQQHQQQQQQQQQQQNQQPKGEGMKGHFLLKLMQFSEHLSGFPGQGVRARDDLTYWQSFVHQFFSQKGVFRHSVYIVGPQTEEHTEKQYEITQPALARYFHAHFESGVERMQLILEKGTMDRPLPNGCHWIENTKASLVYWFNNNSHVVASGSLRAQFDGEQKLELLEFITSGHEEFVSRRMVIEAAKPQHNWVKEWKKLNSPDGKSPEMSKKGKAKVMKTPQNPPPDLDLPETAVKPSMGITEAVFQFLEMVEVMGQMNPLFHFYHTHPGLSPYNALDQYVNQYINNAPGQPPMVNGQPPGNVPAGGPRTPGFGPFPMGASPAAAHLPLPGSPHVMGSPAAGHMQAPGMQMQQSQQGTNSSGPSANTSPASNKRRRPSGIKTEDESGAPTPASMAGGAQVNGVGMQNKGKPPTPRMQKRVKTGNA